MVILQKHKAKKKKKLSTMWPKAQITVCHRKGTVNKSIPDEKAHGVSQSDTLINENHMENSFNNVTIKAQGPSDDNYKNESQKAWTMEMLMKNGDISIGMANEPEQLSDVGRHCSDPTN